MLQKFSFFIIIVFFVFAIFFPVHKINAQDLVERVSGRILLEVERNGEAWYVDPDDNKRYFLGNPADAFQVMKQQGLGISNQDLAKIPVSQNHLIGKDSDEDGPSSKKEGRLSWDEGFSQRLAGKILLQVEDRGEAWYVNPDNNHRYFLGRPADAFAIMKNLGLGIKNRDIINIEEFKKKIFQDQDLGIQFQYPEEIVSEIKIEGNEFYFETTYEDYDLQPIPFLVKEFENKEELKNFIRESEYYYFCHKYEEECRISLSSVKEEDHFYYVIVQRASSPELKEEEERFSYIKYSDYYNKAVLWNPGHECNFLAYSDSSNLKCYDLDIIKSLHFID